MTDVGVVPLHHFVVPLSRKGVGNRAFYGCAGVSISLRVR